MSALPQERNDKRSYKILGLATPSTVTVVRITVIKRWRNPTGVAVQFGK